MNDEIEFLEYVYQNAQMGRETVLRIIKTRNIKDEFEEVLRDEYNDYKKISNSAKGMIERRKKEAKEIGILTKMASYMSIKINLAKSDNISDIAKMLIQGSTMGTIDITEKLNDYKLKSKTVINLGNRLKKIEEGHIEKLKKYL